MATVDEILDRAISLGTTKSNEASNAAAAATAAAQGYATLTPPTVRPVPVVVEPDVNIPANASGVDTALYNSTYDRIIQELSDQFAGFFTAYFPADTALLDSAQDWLSKAIKQGGSGINVSVEDKLWQRDRDRITRASLSAQEEATASWAAKGFPLPPGAAVAAVARIQRDAQLKIQDQSRDRAIKTFEQEIENVRFAIGQAIDLRVKALAAASDYIRALALAPQLAGTLAVSSASAQSNLISAASSFYGNRIKLAELKFTPDRMNAEMTLRAGEQNLTGFNQRLTTQATVAAGIAEGLGKQASAALNAVNGVAQKIVQQDT